jgi:hypothetical protein
MILITTLLIALASWRLWRLTAVDAIFERFRPTREGWFSNLLYCVWCLGFWQVIAVTGLVWWLLEPGWHPLTAALVALAASALAGLINAVEDALVGA